MVWVYEGNVRNNVFLFTLCSVLCKVDALGFIILGDVKIAPLVLIFSSNAMTTLFWPVFKTSLSMLIIIGPAVSLSPPLGGTGFAQPLMRTMSIPKRHVKLRINGLQVIAVIYQNESIKLVCRKD